MTLRPPTIIIVDDDREVVTAIRRALSRGAYRILETTRPQQAVYWLGSEDVDALITDIDMPDLDGLELMEIARNLRPEAVRIVVSGTGTVEAITRAINSGEVHRFVHKPFDPAVLRSIVADALERQEELARAGQAARAVARREQLRDELEHDHPGIASFDRDEDGAYVLDDERTAARERALGLERFPCEDTPA